MLRAYLLVRVFTLRLPNRQWVCVTVSGAPNILNNGNVSLPLTMSQAFTVAGLVTDGLAEKAPTGYWLRAYADHVYYSMVSTNGDFNGGNVEAIVVGR